MIARPLIHMIWKESRELLPVGVATVVGTIVLQAMVTSDLLNLQDHRGLSQIGAIGFKAAAIFAGAVGATIFSAESDRRTLSFLQGLPITSRDFYVGKLVPLAGWVIVLFLISTLGGRVAIQFLGPEPAAGVGIGWRDFWVAVVIAIVSGSIGVCCSLRFHDVYKSLTATGLVAVLVWCATAMEPSLRRFHNTNAEGSWWYTVGLLGSGALLLFHFRIAKSLLRCGIESSESTPRTLSLSPRAPRLGMRLAWQQFSRMKYFYGVVILLSLFLAMVEWIALRRDERNTMALLFLAASSTSLGAMTFSVDQRRHGVGFLADRGVQPTTLWWSRVWTTLVVVVVAAAPCVLTYWAGCLATWTTSPASFPMSTQSLVTYSTCLPLLCFCIGQFFSQRITSPLLSLVSSFGIATMASIWLFSAAMFGVPIIVSTATFLLSLIWATWAYSPSWIVGKRSIRYGWKTIVVPLLTAAACYSGSSAYRVIEIPKAQLTVPPNVLAGDQLPRDASPESARWTSERESRAGFHAEFGVDWHPTAAEPPFLRTVYLGGRDDYRHCEDELAALMDTSKQFQFPFPCEVDDIRISFALPSMLQNFARIRESQGKIDQAWPIYARSLEVVDAMRRRATVPRWTAANQCEQTTYGYLQRWALQANVEQLQTAIGVLEHRVGPLDNLDQLVFDDRFVNQRLVRDPKRFGVWHSAAAGGLFLFEKQRDLRLVDLRADLELQSLHRPTRYRARNINTIWRRVNPHLLASYTEYVDPVDLKAASDLVFAHRRAVLAQFLVLKQMLESPDESYRGALAKTLERESLSGLQIQLVPGRFDRTRDQSVEIPVRRCTVEQMSIPESWPRLSVEAPPAAQGLVLPLPRGLAPSQSAKKHVAAPDDPSPTDASNVFMD